MISVLILTRDEERDIAACLESVRWCDDVQVLDSFSCDRTKDIAKSLGAQVSQRTFDNYAAQRNAGLHTLAFKHSWVFLLDADERPTIELASELIAAAVQASDDVAAFRVRRRDFLWRQWLKHAQISPYYVRLVRPERCRYVREVNEVLEVDGVTGDLTHFLDHYPFSKGISHWIQKHDRYSTMEAALIAEGSLEQVSLQAALLGTDFHLRRRHQKALFYRLPGRWFIKWLYMVIFRRAFLDGVPGLTYAALQTIYEYFIILKTKELLEQKVSKQPAVHA